MYELIKYLSILNEVHLVFSFDASVFMQVFFLNHFSDLRSLMPFMNLQKKNVNGNQMRKMKFQRSLKKRPRLKMRKRIKKKREWRNIWSNNDREFPKINVSHQTKDLGSSENTKWKTTVRQIICKLQKIKDKKSFKKLEEKPPYI